jgi:DNA helicase-2/ATP-dependent DNA helicase PcrA
VAAQVAELLALPPGLAPDGQTWPEPGRAAIRASDIAVLCRKRSQFPALRAAIEARGIPVEVVGLGGLLTVPEVADVVATLRVLHDPAASAPLARLLTGPRWRIGPRDLVALGRRARALAPDHHGRDSGGPAPAAAGDGQDQAGEPGQAPTSVQDQDPLTLAVTDLTAEQGSLVEALDDLGPAAGYSAAGYARFAALAAELRTLRTHTGRPLPDLVGEVERVLGLDVEVAAQPWRDPAVARADLDAFADAAAAFADDEEEPTLAAFLAYLTAAEAEEFGLEAGRPSGTDAVALTTVHAAKGLQWPAVIVPGLATGAKARLFPARPLASTRWTENPRLLPFGLRGDAGDLPALADLSAPSLAEFTEACTARELAEERRLAYVAVTRAAYWVACTGYWWGDGVSPLGPSVFLAEVRAACLAGAGTVARWVPPPGDDATNPVLADPVSLPWPPSPAGARHAAVAGAAALVERARTRLLAGAPRSAGGPELAAGPGPAGLPGGGVGGRLTGRDELGGLTGGDELVAAAWADDTDLLLAEREERRADLSAVWLPGRLTVSSLVTMAADPAELAREIRRPMPRPPAPQARRGSAFHRWLEERFGQQRLLDPADLLGAADEPTDDGDASDLVSLREQFEAGEWGSRWPLEVEVPFEMLIAGRSVRGRIDAVFADAPDGRYDLVDWKTGAPPEASHDRRAAAVQLAAYRLAWAGLADVPVEQVRAAFYYVRHDLTLRPEDLLDQVGLTALIESIPLRD